jgi:hypothetical protein
LDIYRSQRKPIRFDSREDDEEYDEKKGCYSEWFCSSTKGLTKLGLTLSIIGILFLVFVAGIIPFIFIFKNNSGNNYGFNKNNLFDYLGSNNNSTNNSNSSIVNVPKRLGIYYGWPSLVQGANGNLTDAAATFSQFDVVVFGDGISSSSHGDHTNTQTIIQSLNTLGKLSFGYIDLGVTTQNLSIAQMQTVVNNWAAMGVKGIMWDDAG